MIRTLLVRPIIPFPAVLLPLGLYFVIAFAQHCWINFFSYFSYLTYPCPSSFPSHHGSIVPVLLVRLQRLSSFSCSRYRWQKPHFKISTHNAEEALLAFGVLWLCSWWRLPLGIVVAKGCCDVGMVSTPSSFPLASSTSSTQFPSFSVALHSLRLLSITKLILTPVPLSITVRRVLCMRITSCPPYA